MAVMVMTTASGKRLVDSAQRGVSLIESMVAVLLLAILFLGIAHVLARGLVSQRYVNTQNLALLEMREVLQIENNVCGSAPPLSLLEGVSLKAECSDRTEITITVGALEKKLLDNDLPSTTRLSTETSNESKSFFGGDGVIEISDN